jgi:hypothetical protein
MAIFIQQKYWNTMKAFFSNIAPLVILVLFGSLHGFSRGTELDFPLDTLAFNDKFNNRMYAQFDADGHLHVFYSSQTGSNAATRNIYYATDLSGEFETVQLTQTNRMENYPVFVIDQEGVIHLIYVATDDNGYWRAVYRNNSTGQFSDPVYVSYPFNNVATPYLDVDADGIVHLGYNSNNTPGTNYAYYGWYDPATGELGSPHLLSQSNTSGENEVKVKADLNGNIHVVYRDGNLSTGYLRYFNNVSGSLQEIPHDVTGFASYPELLVDSDGVVYIFYRLLSDNRIYLMQYTDGVLGAPEPITPPNSGNPTQYRFASFDEMGNLFFTYANSVTTADVGFFLVHGKPGNLSDPKLIWNFEPGAYLSRNSNGVTARGNGEIATFLAVSTTRDGTVVADIFYKRGFMYGQGPTLQLLTDTLDFGILQPGVEVSRNLVVSNQGQETLLIDGFDITAEIMNWFTLDASFPLSINPMDTLSISISCTMDEAAAIESATLLLHNNSTNAPTAEVTLLMDISTNAGTIPDHDNELQLRIFPNPVTEQSRLEIFSPSAAGATIFLYDALGRRILDSETGNLNPNAWNDVSDVLNHLEKSSQPGMFFLRVEQDGRRQTIRLIR